MKTLASMVLINLTNYQNDFTNLIIFWLKFSEVYGFELFDLDEI